MSGALVGAPASRPAVVGGWMEDYSHGLRCELVDGDLQAAITAYRRVVASRAPLVYSQQARYRWANALRQLGRDDEATTLLRALVRELPKDAPLCEYVRRHLSQLELSDGNRLQYWQGELKSAAAARELGRLREAAEFLAYADGPDGVRSLCEVYEQLTAKHPGRPILVEFIGRSEWPDAAGLLRAALSDPYPAVVAAAAAAAGQLGDAESIPRLTELLGAEQPELRSAAVRGLSRLRAVESVEALIQVARFERDSGIRDSALRALKFIGTERGLEVVQASGGDLPADETDDRMCQFSRWYRQSIRPEVKAQVELGPPSPSPAVRPPPRIGIVISAMTHHAPLCPGEVQPYTTQIRKAWALQRAAFDVCLLAEAEVLADPVAVQMPDLLRPRAPLYPLGSWPTCDVILLDNVFHLSAVMVRTLAAYCQAGGSLVVCGAAGGGYCGDAVTWRRLIGVRRLHAHHFSGELVQLVARNVQTDIMRFLLEVPGDWAGPRRGSFFSHEPLDGQIIAEHDSPPVWAVKLNRYGAGCVLCFNWDIGLSLKGTHDEDELLCRAIDSLIAQEVDPASQGSDEPPGGRAFDSALFSMMQSVRWGRWSQAKDSLDARGLRSLPAEQQAEAVLQLANVYQMENNLAAGRVVCADLAQGIAGDEQIVARLDRLDREPRRMQISLSVGTDFPWWLDIPSWQRLPLPDLGEFQEVPLWVAGPAELPATVRVRVAVPVTAAGKMAVHLKEAQVLGGPEEQARQLAENGPWLRRIGYRARELENGWYEFRVRMTRWDALIGIELITAGT